MVSNKKKGDELKEDDYTLRDSGVKKSIVIKDSKKIGYDAEEGEYIIEGGVTFGNIYIRKENGSNIGKIDGFRISKLKKNEDGKFIIDDSIESSNHLDKLVREKTLIVTKDEAIKIAMLCGLRNAYVLIKQSDLTNESGEDIIKKISEKHLYPVPRTDSFFKDDKFVSVFKVDSSNRNIIPVEVAIDKSICSRDFIKLLDEHIEKEKVKEKKKFKANKEKKDKQKFNELLEGLNGIASELTNPFDV